MGMLWISPHFYVYPIRWCLVSDFFLWKDLFCRTSLNISQGISVDVEEFRKCPIYLQLQYCFLIME